MRIWMLVGDSFRSSTYQRTNQNKNKIQQTLFSQMQSERTSFFDDDDTTILFEFRKPDKSHSKDLSIPPTIKETLTRSSPGQNGTINAPFALHGKLLALYKSSSKTPDFVLNLAHSRLKTLAGTGNNGQYGFTVSRNGSSYEFYSSSKDVVDSWISALKAVCVLLDFHEEYKAVKMIGKGSFAKVYLVECKSNSKSFAVKAFTKESIIVSNKSNAKSSMLNEIEIMRALDHENIIKLYEVYETEKSIYLVLELIQGKSLQDVLKKPLFREETSEIKVINMIRSILDALAYMATKGIMHRDLKPDNILVDKLDKIKIVDFGLATEINLPAYIFKKCGTPGYIAPEVFKYDEKDPKTNYGDKCDVFSAGCIFYYMLFGRPFFDAENASEILRANRKFGSTYEAVQHIKNELKNSHSKINKDGLTLLASLIELEPKQRVSAQEALNHKYFIPSPGVGSVDKSPTGSPKNFNYNPPPKDFGSASKAASDKNTASIHRVDRFAEKDSLYLDLGKPTMNGKMDTLTSGSQNNSLLIQNHGSNANVGSNPGSRSSFAKGNLADMKNKGLSSSFKNKASGGNNLLKAAIFNSSGAKNRDSDDNSPKPESSHFKSERRSSADMSSRFRGNSHSPDPDYGEEEDEVANDEDSSVTDKVQQGSGKEKHPSKMLGGRRFHPFENK